MSWKRFKDLFSKGVKDESYFVLGIDLGNYSSSMAYFDINQNMPEIIDISGGYGKPSVPTVIQYIQDTKEWVYGEYALTNRVDDKDATFTSLVEKLGKSEYTEVAGKPVPLTYLLGLYVKELISNCKSINPKADIAGLVVSVPGYLSEEIREDLRLVFKNAGYEKSFLGFVDDRESIINRYYFDKPVKEEKLLIIDFGSRDVRGGVYAVDPSKRGVNAVGVNCLSFFFDKAIGSKAIDNEVLNLFEQVYCQQVHIDRSRLTQRQREQIEIFAYQHKDLLFQKNTGLKPVKLYFNFAYPPFQHTLTNELITEIVSPYQDKFISFLKDLIKRPASAGQQLSLSDIDAVICVGGGFEMNWARNAVSELFSGSEVFFFRNSKGVISEGASVIAAKKLSLLEYKDFHMIDTNRINYDIGFRIIKDKKESFVPMVESNSFWWQGHWVRQFILTEPTHTAVKLDLYKREKDGSMKAIDKLQLQGFPVRPEGATRISVSLKFDNSERFRINIKDLGFGEIFPASDCVNEFIVHI